MRLTQPSKKTERGLTGQGHIYPERRAQGFSASGEQASANEKESHR
jgi:hypothetical protein